MNERTEVTTEIERRKTESEGAMSDVRERMRNILKSNKGNTGLTVVSVYLQTVKDAVAELERLECKVSSQSALIGAYRGEVAVKDAELVELKRDVQAAEREADRLQGEVERHLIEKAAACEDQRILRRILDDAGEKADRKEVALKDEIERLQAVVDRLMPLAVALGECDENDLPLAIVKAWREPSSYRRDELVRMSEKLAEAESLHSRAFRAARAEVERLTQSLADAEETALRRWNVANKQQMELERLRRELAESERVAQLGIRAIQERDELRGEAERLKSLDREIVSQRGAAQAALRQIAEMARCGLEYPVDAKGGTDET